MKNGTTAKAAPASKGKDNVPSTGAPKQKSAKERAAEALKRSGIDPTGMTYAAMRSSLKRLKEAGELEDGRKGNGGARENSGQQTTDEADPTLAQARASHLAEEIELTIEDAAAPTGIRKVKRQTMLAILDQLRDDALEAKHTPQARSTAAHEYFDRTLGKAAQEFKLKHSGEIGTYTAKRPSKHALAAKKAYAESLRKGN